VNDKLLAKISSYFHSKPCAYLFQRNYHLHSYLITVLFIWTRITMHPSSKVPFLWKLLECFADKMVLFIYSFFQMAFSIFPI
jgi:hypothetical protein